MYFGTNIYTGEKVLYDRYQYYQENGSANLLIHGISGTGKTQLCRREIKELESLHEGARVFYFLPGKKAEKERIGRGFLLSIAERGKIECHLHELSELNKQFFLENGLLIKKAENSPVRPAYIYIDGLEELHPDHIAELEKLIASPDGRHNIYTICTKVLYPEEQYHNLLLLVDRISILAPTKSEQGNSSLMQYLTREEKNTFDSMRDDDEIQFFGVLCSKRKNGADNQLFFY